MRYEGGSNARRARRFWLAGFLLLAGCGGVEPPESDFWRPWYGEADLATGDPAGTPDMSTGMPPGRPDLAMSRSPDLAMGGGGGGTLVVTVTTATANGRYAPRNIGAIWITDGGGKFVKTLTEWGSRRRQYLSKWLAASGGNTVDAITSATINSHGTRTGTWNGTNASRAAVADGAYRVCFEMTEYDGAGPSDCVSFSKGRMPATDKPADATNFKNRSLVYTP